MQQKFVSRNSLLSAWESVGMNAYCIKYIKSPAILTTSQFNLAISSNLVFVLHIIGHNVFNSFYWQLRIRELFRVLH